MIKIKRLLSYGGACPYQLEAITTDDKWLYIRYRHGVLSCSLADSREKWMKDLNDEKFEFYRESIGEPLDGYADHDLIFPHLRDKIQFPEGFRLESGR